MYPNCTVLYQPVWAEAAFKCFHFSVYSESHPSPGTPSRTEVQDDPGHTETRNEISRVDQEQMGNDSLCWLRTAYTLAHKLAFVSLTKHFMIDQQIKTF